MMRIGVPHVETGLVEVDTISAGCQLSSGLKWIVGTVMMVDVLGHQLPSLDVSCIVTWVDRCMSGGFWRVEERFYGFSASH